MRAPGGWWRLVAVAAALEAVYAGLLLWPMRIWARPVSPDTNLVQTFGIERGGAVRYVAVVALLFGLYAAALLLVVRAGAGRRLPAAVALGAAAVFCATLVLTHPLSSADVFNYIASARVQWVYGDNPLTTPPLAHPEDPFFRLIFFWKEVPSPYGPLWSLLTAVPHALGGDRPAATVAAFKATSALFLLGTGALAGATAERLRPGTGAVAVVALTWNPLAVWHVAGNGHNDAVMCFFLALAAYLLVRGRAGPALIAFVASALVKFATLLLVPAILVWWWRTRTRGDTRALAPWLAGAAALAVTAYAPFWQGLDTFRTSLDEGSYFTASGPAALRGALVHVISVPSAESVAAWTGRLAFVAVYAALLRRLWKHAGRKRRSDAGASSPREAAAGLIAVGALALTAYLVLAATYVAPWYVLWPLTLAVLAPWRREVLAPALALSLGAMSVLLWATWARARYAADPLGDWYPMHLLSFLGIAPLTLGAWYWGWRADRGGRADAASPDVHPPVAQREVARTGLEG